ncbi:MAG: glycosyl transferase family 2 [Candidatus Berkelbacteria bacterium Licking1014_7]|uniref:Glycosyl transferase family 2 n=1 Tax=Candidatus Berkelbacteria bacterium Licking1014_7 TaxID=2017147 RepID=A0A554LJ16_9BACT|nr:MAG: glycosyl transferase family 2 [Candidatus Berkelbacteria bacterium Licking1014_7]
MKFSVITPSYNQGQFIDQTIKSVLSQTGDFEIEYIVADGGSTDNSVKIIKKYHKLLKEKKYPTKCQKIKYIWWSKKDKGQSDAINQGFKKASGDIVAWLNSDDYYLPNCFQLVAQKFSQNPQSQWLTGYCQIVGSNGRPVRHFIQKYKNFWLNHYSYNKLLVLNFISQSATFWRHSMHDKIGWLNEHLHYAMDYDFWLRIGKISDPIILKDNVAQFRIHAKSKGKTNFNQQFQEDFEVVKKYTKNKFLIVIHNLHNCIITKIYNLIHL